MTHFANAPRNLLKPVANSRVRRPTHATTLALAVLLVTASMVLAACTKPHADSGAGNGASNGEPQAGAALSVPTPAESAEPVGPAEDDPRDQRQLALDIRAAEALRGSDATAVQLQKVRRDWLGKRYHWQVTVLPQLCSRAERCNVLPFDMLGEERKLVQGWMPRLDLDADNFAKLQRQCADKGRCEIAFAGTMSKLTLSTERFTAVGFRDVQVLDAN